MHLSLSKHYARRKFEGGKWKIICPQKISTIEEIKINGVSQYVSINSENINNPILLVLHGGPGDTCLPLMRYYNKELEKYYTVVILEQRGSGKSYYRFKKSDNHRHLC